MSMSLFGQALYSPFAAIAAHIAGWGPATARTEMTFRPLWAARDESGSLSPAFRTRLADLAARRWIDESGMLLGTDVVVVTSRIGSARPVLVLHKLVVATTLAARHEETCTLRHDLRTAEGALVALMESQLSLAASTGWADLPRHPVPPLAVPAGSDAAVLRLEAA